MRKQVRILSGGISVGVAALAAAALAATPAVAALQSLSWHVNKSNAYCETLDNGTDLGRMRAAQCRSSVLALQVYTTNTAIQQAKSTAEVAASLDWPGPGH